MSDLAFRLLRPSGVGACAGRFGWSESQLQSQFASHARFSDGMICIACMTRFPRHCQCGQRWAQLLGRRTRGLDGRWSR